MTKQEVWRPVVGHESSYEVSDLGRVRGLDRHIGHPKGGTRLWRGKVLVEWPMSTGYVAVTLCFEGKRFVRTVHSIVAEAFHGPAPFKHEVAHTDGVRTNNRAKNLRWKTRKENHADKQVHGTMPQGETHYKAKLTKDRVVIARQLARTGLSQEQIGSQLGVSRGAIKNVLNGHTWKHV